MPRCDADLCNHGATCGHSWRWPAGYVLRGRARCVTAEWNGPDVHADECLPFGAMAEADFQPAKRCPPVPIRRSPNSSRPPTCTSYRELNKRRRGEKSDDDTHDRDTQRVARRAARSVRGGEGTHATQRRAGAPPARAAVGSDRQTVSIRDRQRDRLAGGPLPSTLAAPRLPLHVRARLHGGMSVLLIDRGRVQRYSSPPGEPRRHADGGVAGAAREAAGV